MNIKTIYRWTGCWLLVAGCWMMISCSDDPEPAPASGHLLQLQSLTRGDDADDLPVGTVIQMLLVPQDGSGDQSGTVEYRGSGQWNSQVYVKEGATYSVYGFMPASIATSSAMTGTNKNVISMTGFSPLSKQDVCLVIGVKNGEVDGEPEAGQFRYETSTGGNNSIKLLMSHIYSDIAFKLKISSGYDRLRTIKLKELKLKVNVTSQDGKMTAQATLNQTKTNTVNPFTIRKVEGSNMVEPEMSLFKDEDGVALQTATTIDVDGYFAAGYAKDISLISTFDVYDKAGNLLGERTAENKLEYVVSGIQWNQRKEVTLTVDPTYLYVLSDPDLDNPTVNVEE